MIRQSKWNPKKRYNFCLRLSWVPLWSLVSRKRDSHAYSILLEKYLTADLRFLNTASIPRNIHFYDRVTAKPIFHDSLCDTIHFLIALCLCNFYYEYFNKSLITKLWRIMTEWLKKKHFSELLYYTCTNLYSNFNLVIPCKGK